VETVSTVGVEKFGSNSAGWLPENNFDLRWEHGLYMNSKAGGPLWSRNNGDVDEGCGEHPPARLTQDREHLYTYQVLA
jgi:hypothetical protein